MDFLSNKPLYLTDTILRDAHQSQAATRMRVEDMLPACEVLDSIGYWSLECWGGATFDSCMRFLNEDPWERLRKLRKALPHTKLQMLFRGQNSFVFHGGAGRCNRGSRGRRCPRQCKRSRRRRSGGRSRRSGGSGHQSSPDRAWRRHRLHCRLPRCARRSARRWRSVPQSSLRIRIPHRKSCAAPPSAPAHSGSKKRFRS